MANSPRMPKTAAAKIREMKSGPSEDWTSIVNAGKKISKTCTKTRLMDWEKTIAESVTAVETAANSLGKSGQSVTEEIFLEQFGRSKVYVGKEGNLDLAVIATIGLAHGAIAIHPDLITCRTTVISRRRPAFTCGQGAATLPRASTSGSG